MITTGIPQGKLNKPTSDAELNDLVNQARTITGKNWQAIEYIESHTKSGFFAKEISVTVIALCVEVGGVLPFKEFTGVHTVNEAKNYLRGVITGFNIAKAQP